MAHNSKKGKTYASPFINAQDVKNNNSLYRSIKQDPVRIMTNIIRSQKSMYTKEIIHWKNARGMAENVHNPSRIDLYDLYDDVALDGFIIGIMGKRILKVSNKPYGLYDRSTGEIDDEATKLIRKQWALDLIKHSMGSKFYGHSLTYFNEFDKASGQFKQVELVPRRHVKPEICHWVKNEHDHQGESYLERPYANYVIGVGNKSDLGLLNPAAPLYILKKHSWTSWDEFEEIFGVPIRTAKTASTDPKVQDELERWLSEMGHASYGIFPEGTELDIKESKQTDAFRVFDEKRKAANEELEIMILGIKNASQNSGTYGQQKALQDEQDEVETDDKAWMANLWNDEVIPRLRLHGYPIGENLEFRYDETNDLPPEEKVKVYETLHKMGYKLDVKQVSADLNITLEEGEDPATEPTDDPKPPAKPKKGKKAIEVDAKTSLQIIAEMNKKYFQE